MISLLFSLGHKSCCVVAIVLNIQHNCNNTKHNVNVWPNENRAVEMGVGLIDRGFKRNLTQLSGRYHYSLVHLYVLLNRARITEPFSVTCALKKRQCSFFWNISNKETFLWTPGTF